MTMKRGLLLEGLLETTGAITTGVAAEGPGVPVEVDTVGTAGAGKIEEMTRGVGMMTEGPKADLSILPLKMPKRTRQWNQSSSNLKGSERSSSKSLIKWRSGQRSSEYAIFNTF